MAHAEHDDRRLSAPARCALIVAHPGHEFRVYGWMKRERPVVGIVTDGSGSSGSPRIALTEGVLRTRGVPRSTLMGAISDREVYRAMLAQDADFFRDISDRISELLVEWDVAQVAGDAIEGYNPTHDVCRLMIDRAVALAEPRSGRRIENLSFCLTGPPRPEGLSERALTVQLDEATLSEKLTAIEAYAETAGGILVEEVAEELRRYGREAFAQEFLDTCDANEALARFERERPFYESHGEGRVASGRYGVVIRYREHVAPIARALASS